MSVLPDFGSRLDSEVGHTRIYTGHAPDTGASDERDYIVYNRIGAIHEHHLLAASGLVTQTIQVDSYSRTYKGAWDQAELVREGFDGFRGTMGSTNVRMCHLTAERDDFLQPLDGSHRGWFRVSQDYDIAHFESVPTF